uniref:Mannosylglycerate hydrolase MGH1-like glycoside hydrolase domain-containing protein n=1 Tax=Ciona savignyi TaxID=51511 RepID=H2Z169_CIOSA
TMAEKHRLLEDKERTKNWKRWGPYLSERQWGTVREDYSPDGNCWEYLSHEESRSRAYRWGEDGLMGFCDRQCRLCFSVALWNGKDPILKERLFGLTGPEGNHGEDVKENYYYLDSSPTHSYMKMLYKYPQGEFPYSDIVHENRRRGLEALEYELDDTGKDVGGIISQAMWSFNNGKFWDVQVEYAKNAPQDILCQITVSNRGSESAEIHVLPTLWYRNTWIWGCTHEGCTLKPSIRKMGDNKVNCKHQTLGRKNFEIDNLYNRVFMDVPDQPKPQLLFTENETNTKDLFNIDQYTKYTKDAFHRYVVHNETEATSPGNKGTKVAAYYKLLVPAGESVVLHSRLVDSASSPKELQLSDFNEIIKQRKTETDLYYKVSCFPLIQGECMKILRQACAGLLWSKQFYHYIVDDWLKGDADQIPPPQSRLQGRNKDWKHLFNRDVVSMPDKWEYPWYASWDLAFHMIPFCKIDPEFAKNQLLLFLREWYMAPSGQIPAYEFAFDDVNPPVHAWSVYRVYKLTAPKGQRDQLFLARCFQKLILNFTWWVNRKDPSGKNIFSGGFLGLDNIGVFDRSKPLPTGGHLEQADGTAWMAFFCVVMLDMALELSLFDASYEDMASKFFEHFIMIIDAMNAAGHGEGLWDEEDGFYYDVLRFPNSSHPLRVRSMVGLIPLYACLVLDGENTEKLLGFKKRTQWFLDNRKDLNSRVSAKPIEGKPNRILLAIPTLTQLKSVLKYLLDENEFLSPFGIRSLSKYWYTIIVWSMIHCCNIPTGSSEQTIRDGCGWGQSIEWIMYRPNRILTLFVNYLIIEALERYDYFYGDTLKVECPTGSGNFVRLKEVSKEISRRLVSLFEPDPVTGRRPCHGDNPFYADDPCWKDLVLFYEYFHAENGR